jgi:LytS/YehU family sensor histidine kinase
MNPHLLFNALNTVAALIPTDAARAEDTIVRLSELYRGVLESSRRTSHSLATELELCMNYLNVEQARLGSRLRTELIVDPAIDPVSVQVPVLTLQPLVENAVRHGIGPRASGGTIRLRIQSTPEAGLLVSVEDDGVGFGNSARRGSGTALENCRQRLRLGYGERGGLSISAGQSGGTTVQVRLPLAPEGHA